MKRYLALIVPFVSTIALGVTVDTNTLTKTGSISSTAGINADIQTALDGKASATQGNLADSSLQKSQNLADVADPAAAFNAIKQAATTTYAGVVQLATGMEVESGESTTKAVTPWALKATKDLAQGSLQRSFNLTDVDDPLAAFNTIKQDAATNFAGVVQLANSGDVSSGTDAAKAITSAALSGSPRAATLLSPGYSFSKTWTALDSSLAGVISSTPIVFMTVGDSLAEQWFVYGGFQALTNQYGIRGVMCGSGLADGFGSTYSAGAYQATEDFTRWWNGAYDVLPAGGEIIYDYNGSNAIWANRVDIYFLKEIGAGTFKAQVSVNGGAYTDVSGYTAVDTSGTAASSGYINFTATSSSDISANIRLKLVGVSGTCRFPGAMIWNAYGSGVVLGTIARPGKDYSNFRQCPQEVITPILSRIAPTAILFCNTGDTSIANLDELFGRLSTAYSGFDKVVIGVWPASSGSFLWENPILKSWAATNGAGYWSPETLWPTWAQLVSADMSADNTHPKGKAYTLAGRVLSQMLFLPDNIRGIQRTPAGGWVFGSPVTPSNLYGNYAWNVTHAQFNMPVAINGASAGLTLWDRGATTSLNYYTMSLNSGTLTVTDPYGGFYFKNNSGTYNFWSSNGILGKSSSPWINLYLDKTITAAGTTGDQTINKLTGRVNFAAGATSLTVTNNLVTANSIISPSLACAPNGASTLSYVAASGSFTLYLGTGGTTETAVSWTVSN